MKYVIISGTSGAHPIGLIKIPITIVSSVSDHSFCQLFTLVNQSVIVYYSFFA